MRQVYHTKQSYSNSRNSVVQSYSSVVTRFSEPVSGNSYTLKHVSYTIDVSPSRNMTNHSFNPITQTVQPLVSSTTLPSLQQCCRHVILANMTLKNIAKVNDLPIPRLLAKFVSALQMSDFIIKLADLSRENYITRTYPATCAFNEDKVIIKAVLPGSDIDTTHPSYLTSFKERGFLCCVYKEMETLHDLIITCIKDGSTFNSIFIWRVIHCVCSQLILVNPHPYSKLKPTTIVFLNDEEIFLDINESDGDEDVSDFDLRSPEPIYHAPEVITRNNPTIKAFVWSLGCIMFELLGLEPAYFDIEGANPLQMYMNIAQGQLPSFQNLPTIPSRQELNDLTSRCMNRNPEIRPTLEEILLLATNNIPPRDAGTITV